MKKDKRPRKGDCPQEPDVQPLGGTGPPPPPPPPPPPEDDENS